MNRAMETIEKSLQAAISRNKSHKAKVEKYIRRAKALERISESLEASIYYRLAELEKKDESRHQNYIQALKFYLKHQTK
ncbi:hypothetical protein M3P19_12040 [Muricauda sp. 2012CJ35-5]|uniref:Uncharacterized protein n=1 Tax=Flagellimonas spongiicola TaxID=2942208 RepID=A0ABT0PTL9_9FLAO|nr:hypothetical protein [Allomuricauda spongiicola]MCL6274743.1 hypothetical protein [Allomuricauda spongiicola]